MSTTPNFSIWSPDGSTEFDPAADLGVLATSVDTALGTVKNGNTRHVGDAVSGRAYFGTPTTGSITASGETYIGLSPANGLDDAQTDALWLTVDQVTKLSIKKTGNINTASQAWSEAAGSVALPATIAAGGGGTRNITFPTGRFSVAPLLTMSVTQASRLNLAITALSATAATIRYDNFTSGAAGGSPVVHWHAVQMLSGAAAG